MENKIKSLIESKNIENVLLAYQLAKGQRLDEDIFYDYWIDNPYEVKKTYVVGEHNKKVWFITDEFQNSVILREMPSIFDLKFSDTIHKDVYYQCFQIQLVIKSEILKVENFALIYREGQSRYDPKAFIGHYLKELCKSVFD